MACSSSSIFTLIFSSLWRISACTSPNLLVYLINLFTRIMPQLELKGSRFLAI
jgi:hypothetical protein